MKRVLLALTTAVALVLAVLGSRSQERPHETGDSIKPLRAIGAIQPRISPDGSRLVCSYQGAIWVTPRKGGAMTRLSDGDGFDMEPVWSHDGQRIAFVRFLPQPPAGELHLIHADGKEIVLPKKVQVPGTIIYQKIEMHPDGKRVLGVFRQDGKNFGLAWYDLETGRVTSVVPTPPPWGRYALSPDGQWIVYTETMDVPGQQSGHNGPQADVWKVPAAGGKAEKVVRFPSRIHDLCFDAKGKALIVVTELGGAHYDLWQVPLSHPLAGMRKLTFGQADEDRPSVSGDGRWLAYTDNRAGATALVVRDLASGEDETLRIDRLDFGRPTGTLRLATRDKDSKQPLVARVSLQAGGKFFAPPGALHRMLRSVSHFYCDQSAELIVPAGKYRLRAFRGPEYKVAYRDIDVEPGQTSELTVGLTRWIHAAKAGFFSGENHIHANYGYGQWYNTPRTMLQQCAGEDLNVCNFMVANSDTDGVFDRAFFRGRPDPLSTAETILYWNQEFRSTLWGHMTLVNLKQVVEPVFTGFKDTTNPWDIPTNADVADRTHWQKGLVNYTHPAQNADDPFQNPYAAKGLPVDVALGKIDTLDINHAYVGAVPIWHRLMNCGFRVPATAGTDCFLNRIFSALPGGDRVYVRVDGPLNYEKWIEGMRAGRSFVSNGPMLEFTLGKHELGEAVKLDVAGKMKVRAKATSQFPLAKLELIYNGKVVATGKMPADELSATIDLDVSLERSGWLAVRATGPGHPDSPVAALYAHSNPIYVELAGARPRSKADAQFFLAWIDKLALEQRSRDRIPNEELRRHVLDQLDAARAVFGKIAL